jgi:hypothetical protein
MNVYLLYIHVRTCIITSPVAIYFSAVIRYDRSWVLLSLTSTVGQTSRVLLADVIPWINMASLALYIARTMSRLIWSSEAVLRCWVRLLWLKHRNLSLSRSKVGLRHHLSACIDVARILCTHYIDDLLPYAPLELCSYWGCGQVFHLYMYTIKIIEIYVHVWIVIM